MNGGASNPPPLVIYHLPVNPDRHYLLGELLKNVSRSFYLTLRVLPEGMREPVALGYLLARAADTIADTELVAPARRLELLLSFRQQLNHGADERKLAEISAALTGQQSNRHERILLESIPAVLAILEESGAGDRVLVRGVVTTLTQGMELDLITFPNETSGQLAALASLSELENYTYLVAGCVGDFWTRMTAAHTAAFAGRDIPDIAACGIRFGKALQYTNVLRDCPKDLRIGRCYLPADMLAAAGLEPRDLLNSANSAWARPVLLKLLGNALDHYREALRYTLTIPASYGRLRLACLWPVLIGLETLKQLAENEHWLDPEKKTKVSRNHVYRLMGFSLPMVGSDTVVRAWVQRLIADVEKRCGVGPVKEGGSSPN
jgi:farnesyl-diphosphate farnesyltransferase